MWPYDYFNQYSALINEFDVEDNDNKKRKVFVAKCYDENPYEYKKEAKITAAIEAAGKEIGVEFEITNDKKQDNVEKEETDDIISYGLEISMPKYSKKGDINIDILKKIIEARLLICDITPGYKGKCFFVKKTLIFNANVMAELGLALAWKTAEQVMLIYDLNKFDLSKFDLPFNIRDYFCRGINFNDTHGELKKFIIERARQLDDKKNITIKNIKGKIDSWVLNFLLLKKGLPFSGTEINLESIRYLLSLDLIRAEQYPLKAEGVVDYIYYFTELGRFFINKGLNVKVFPKIFADLFVVRYWEGYEKTHKQEFDNRHKKFSKEHGEITWKTCADELIKQFESKGIKLPDKDILSYYNIYLKLAGKNSELLREEIAGPWEKAIKEIIRKKNKKD
jgi:hypothetical protein